MFIWIASIAVCTSELATDCSVYVYGRSFEHMNECQVELQQALSISRENGALASGICKRVILDGTPA